MSLPELDESDMKALVEAITKVVTKKTPSPEAMKLITGVMALVDSVDPMIADEIGELLKNVTREFLPRSKLIKFAHEFFRSIRDTVFQSSLMVCDAVALTGKKRGALEFEAGAQTCAKLVRELQAEEHQHDALEDLEKFMPGLAKAEGKR